MKNLTLNILLIFWAAVSTAGVPTTQLTETDAIRWDSSLTLPQIDGKPNIGIAGVFSGRIDGKLLIAGGANFPDRTPAANGEKNTTGIYIYTTLPKAGKSYLMPCPHRGPTVFRSRCPKACSASVAATPRNARTRYCC